MSIILVGLNHRTAPVEVREKLAFSDSNLTSALHTLVHHRYVEEVLIVSTCNRVEILAAADGEPYTLITQIYRFLHEFHDLSQPLPETHFYRHADRSAVRHLFRVAASLDSMVVGEAQILGQVKSAYNQAMQAGTVGRTLNQLLQQAFNIAKRVRSETQIGTAATSISSVAVELAKEIFDELAGKRVLLLGAGEMAELAARYLISEGVRNFLICNRTRARAEELQQHFGGEVIEYERLKQELTRADIVICSTGAPDYVITAKDCHEALVARRNRPIFLIDISVPRNIDPAAGKLDNIFLFDIDDLEKVVAENYQQRQQEAYRAEAIVDTEVEAFYARFTLPDIGPTVAALREHLLTTVMGEFDRVRPKLGNLTPEQEDAIRQQLLQSLVNKMLHPLILSLREGSKSPECNIVELYHNVYNLNNVNNLNYLQQPKSNSPINTTKVEMPLVNEKISR
jgi:glutamyl-tRNA reductase